MITVQTKVQSQLDKSSVPPSPGLTPAKGPKLPGHAERKSASSEPSDRLSSENSDQDEDWCCERFVKVEVKHVTDGEVSNS